MMKANKNIYRAILILSFLGLNACVLFGISSVWSYLNTGADRSSRLNVQIAFDETYLPKMVWAIHENEGRPMEDGTLQEIEKDYLKAWYVRNRAFAANNREGIADYYTDSARIKLYDIMALNRETGTTIAHTTLEHHPKVEFYSEDGQLVVFTDESVTSHSEIYLDEILISKQSDTTSYQVMMLLEDGFWRIRHLVEIPSKLDTITPKKQEVTIKKRVSELKGVNYYPQKSPWNMFGNAFNDSIVNSDFELIQKMGLNTIRIFVPYVDFGKANVNTEKLQQLKSTLDLAQNHRLKVVITLFDFYGDYEIRDWTLTHRHAEQIVTALKDHEAIIAWDIKNEPDLDFESRGKEKVLAWLRQMVRNIKSWDENHLVTIGWSSPEAAVNLANEVDFVSFHYYNEVSKFITAYKELNEVVIDKPLVLQEYGYSSYGGIWNAFLGSEEKQAVYYKEMQALLEKEQLPFLFWTLYDFEEIPTSVVGRLPWRKQRQQYFGIRDADGQPKASNSHLISKK